MSTPPISFSHIEWHTGWVPRGSTQSWGGVSPFREPHRKCTSFISKPWSLGEAQGWESAKYRGRVGKSAFKVSPSSLQKATSAEVPEEDLHLSTERKRRSNAGAFSQCLKGGGVRLESPSSNFRDWDYYRPTRCLKVGMQTDFLFVRFTPNVWLFGVLLLISGKEQTKMPASAGSGLKHFFP